MTYDFEIYRIAYTLWEEYGSQAPLMVAKGAAEKKESGDAVEQLVWAAVLNAMLEWMRTEREPGERLN
jgi:predicted negative regulator of RcsB-dependent stress response